MLWSLDGRGPAPIHGALPLHFPTSVPILLHTEVSAESKLYLPLHGCVSYLQFLTLAMTLWTLHAQFQGCWAGHNLSTQFPHKGVHCQ
jgi:hypothetical protein